MKFIIFYKYLFIIYNINDFFLGVVEFVEEEEEEEEDLLMNQLILLLKVQQEE
jgi:hypothetical protein